MELETLTINPEEIYALFLTHSDPDHAGGLTLFTQAEIFLPEMEEPIVLGQDKRMIFGREMRGVNLVSRVNYTLLGAGALISMDGLTIQAVAVPGHTPGSTAYILNDTIAITGDMAVIKKGELVSMPGFINNDPQLAEETAAWFNEKYRDLEVIATAHDGVLLRFEE